MGSVPPGYQRLNVKILQYDGSARVSLIIALNENEVVARGQIYAKPGDSITRLKTLIMDLLHEKLPGYCGDFQFAVLLRDLLNMAMLDREDEDFDERIGRNDAEDVDEFDDDGDRVSEADEDEHNDEGNRESEGDEDELNDEENGESEDDKDEVNEDNGEAEDEELEELEEEEEELEELEEEEEELEELEEEEELEELEEEEEEEEEPEGDDESEDTEEEAEDEQDQGTEEEEEEDDELMENVEDEQDQGTEEEEEEDDELMENVEDEQVDEGDTQDNEQDDVQEKDDEMQANAVSNGMSNDVAIVAVDDVNDENGTGECNDEEMDDNVTETIHVRLTSLYMGPTEADIRELTNNNPRKRRRSSLDDSGRTTSQSHADVVLLDADNPPPPKRCRKDEWQCATNENDPVDILTHMISKHLEGFACVPGLHNTAREVAMNAYFDWLDNVGPRHPGHFVIIGNPGVGKTTGAWALANFLAEAGIVRKDAVVEAHRDDLVDRYVGGTEVKTNLVINSARGGVIIFDEIYSLNKPFSPNDSGKEALTTIMKNMTKEAAPVFMFLGYKNQMKDFVNMNAGFQRRIRYTIEMPDYNATALAQIVRVKLKESKLTMSDDVGELEFYFQGLNPAYLHLHNASVAVSLLTYAQSNARKRALEMGPDQRKGVSQVLRKIDFIEALKILSNESSDNSENTEALYNIFN